MPDRAPQKLVRRQKMAHIMTGPKAAPKPAQAKETMPNTELLGSRAMTMPRMAMIIRVTRAMSMVVFSSTLTLNTPWKMSSEMEEEAASSWESQVDMVQARMPARITPASRPGSTPRWAIWSETTMMMRSGSSRGSRAPAWTMLMPSTPMKMATNMETNTQTEATRRLRVIFLGSSMAMKRSRMWGMPK